MRGKSLVRKQKGMSVAIALFIISVVVVIGFSVGMLGYNHLNQVNTNKYKSQTLYTAEAGVQKALLELKSNREWDGTHPEIEMEKLPTIDSYYTLSISNNLSGNSYMLAPDGVQVPPGLVYIISTGQGPRNIKTTIAVMARSGRPFPWGIVGDEKVTLKGNIKIDAYNSENGQQEAGQGSVACNNYLENSMVVSGSAANIDGDLYVGPDADPDSAFRINGFPKISGEKKIMSSPINLPSVELPPDMDVFQLPDAIQIFPQGDIIAGGSQTPIDNSDGNAGTEEKLARSKISQANFEAISNLSSWGSDSNSSSSGNKGGQEEEIILQPGRYDSGMKITNNQTVILQGPGRFAFDGLFMTGKGILISDTTNGPVEVYINGDIKMTGTSATGGIFNRNLGGTPRPADLLILGTKECTAVDITGNSDSYMALYTPYAQVDMRGNSQMWGAVVGKILTIHGNPDFHFDTSLKNFTPLDGMEAVSWHRL